MDARSQAEKTAADQAEVIAPSARTVVLADGRTANVRALNLGTLPKFARIIAPAFGALVALAPASSSPGDSSGQGADPGADQLLDLIAEHGEVLAEAIALSSDLTLEAAQELELDDALAVVLKVWEVNQDFFIRRVLPMLRARMGLVRA